MTLSLHDVIDLAKRFSAAERLLLAKNLLDGLVLEGSAEVESASAGNRKVLLFDENAQPADDIRAQQSAALAREEAAYIKLYPQLKVTHLGRYVAIYQGKLIDEDNELAPLVERVRTKLPNQVVWMTQVKDEPIQTIVKRGNRLLRSLTC